VAHESRQCVRQAHQRIAVFVQTPELLYANLLRLKLRTQHDSRTLPYPTLWGLTINGTETYAKA